MSWFNWISRLLAWKIFHISRFLVRILFLLLSRWRVRGRENVPSEGPVLIASNHLHLVDVPLLAVSFGRAVLFMAKRELFHSRVEDYIFRSLGSFPVHRGQIDRKALRQAQQVFTDGLALVMFPEGTRSKNSRLKSAFSGSALVALRNDVPILPVGITGTEKIKGVAWLLRRPRLTVNIGCPFHLPPVNSRLTKTELAKLTDDIMKRIAELLPLEYRGIYADEGN